VLAHADKDIGQVVIGKDFIELDVPGEDDILDAERFNIGGKPLVVALGVAAAHKEQPAFGVQVLFVPGKGADDILLVFVRRNPPDKDQVNPIIAVAVQHGLVGGLVVIFKRDQDGTDFNRAGEAGFAQVLLVVIR